MQDDRDLAGGARKHPLQLLAQPLERVQDPVGVVSVR
jgi:hypothetical protein